MAKNHPPFCWFEIGTSFAAVVGYRNVLSDSKFTPVNDKNEFGFDCPKTKQTLNNIKTIAESWRKDIRFSPGLNFME